MAIQTKSVFSRIDKNTDGLRILATRYRGRRLPKSRYDVWMASLGPSERLLKSIQAGRITWRSYQTRYRAELLGKSEAGADNPLIRNRGQKFTLRLLKRISRRSRITLLCPCDEEATRCHRFILADVIRRI